MITRAPGAFSAGARVSIRICSAKSIRPRPIETRPISLMRERGPLRNATSPRMNRTGATAAMLNDSTCTIRVVPTLAPSMIASAGTRLTRPSEVNELVISAVAVLLWSRAVRPRPAAKAVKRLFSALPSRRRRSGPNARKMPLWTMCRPHSSNATPPIRSSRTMLPMNVRLPNLCRMVSLSANHSGSITYYHQSAGGRPPLSPLGEQPVADVARGRCQPDSSRFAPRRLVYFLFVTDDETTGGLTGDEYSIAHLPS